jgi:hypothetical protein
VIGFFITKIQIADSGSALHVVCHPGDAFR